MSTQQVIRCPKCGLTDYRNVWSIIQESTHTSEVPHTVPLVWQGKTYYLQTKEQVTTVSALAGRLYPPQRLLEKIEKVTLLGLIGALILTMLASIISFGAILELIKYGFSQGVFESFRAIVLVLMGPLAVFFFFLLVLPAYKNSEELEDKERRRLRALEKYLRLCYCYKCDVVFDPEDISGKWARPEAMSEYLLFD